jgi:hypothetical protein
MDGHLRRVPEERRRGRELREGAPEEAQRRCGRRRVVVREEGVELGGGRGPEAAGVADADAWPRAGRHEGQVEWRKVEVFFPVRDCEVRAVPYVWSVPSRERERERERSLLLQLALSLGVRACVRVGGGECQQKSQGRRMIGCPPADPVEEAPQLVSRSHHPETEAKRPTLDIFHSKTATEIFVASPSKWKPH